MFFGQAAQFLASVLPWPAPGSWTDNPPWFVNIHYVVKMVNDDGTSVIDPKTKKQKVIVPGRACTSVEQATNQLEYRLIQKGGTDLYVCMSAQREGKEKLDRRGRKYWTAKRSLSNTIWLKSLWIDVDVKPGA